MGCISSKQEMEDKCPNMFQVMNVDDEGNKLNPGQLEITDVDLVLHQRDKASIYWPLRNLRRYGYDAEHFSFESGRRCVTGPGIYAFRCRRAEQLFNVLQSRIQTRNNDAEADLQPGNYLDPAMRRAGGRFSSQNGLSTRLGSVGSTSGSAGPMSPQATASPPLPGSGAPVIPPLPASRLETLNLYANEEVIAAMSVDADETNNNNKSAEAVQDHSYINNTVLEEMPYLLLEEASSPTLDNHLYVNIVPGTGNVVQDFVVAAKPGCVVVTEHDDEHVHNYANLDTDEVEGLPRRIHPLRIPTTPTGTEIINYIELDLEPGGEPPRSPTNSIPPDSPRKPAEGYATIDIKKTVALSQSVNPNFNDSEGSRKTRHGDPSSITRHSSSVSD